MVMYEMSDIRVWSVPFKFLPVGAYFHRVMPYREGQEWILESSRIWTKWQQGSAQEFTGKALNGAILNIGPDEPVRQLFVKE